MDESGQMTWADHCHTYWGTHGCRFPKGHAGFCVCCDPQDDWDGYVGGFPYYGPGTEFYSAGEDHVSAQAARDRLAEAFQSEGDLEDLIASERQRITEIFATGRSPSRSAPAD